MRDSQPKPVRPQGYKRVRKSKTIGGCHEARKTMRPGTLKEKIMGRFGEDAKTTEVDDVLVVHLDKPDEIEIGRRIQEVRQGLVLEDDCPLCRDLASHPPEVVIYDEDSVLYLGHDQLGSFASGSPRRRSCESYK